ncbi:MAG: rhomboid family intramembrane serine protease [Bdellovibrionaceae bacterium]|nr:rhomboid family intramembrane serine protease [Pseudobdellovibrionaceae bacterium]
MAMPPFPPVVKWLMIVSVSVWFIGQVLLEGFFGFPLSEYFSLQPGRVIFDFQIWQPLTYIFLHSQSQITHILFNMLMLWFMGGELEQRWGGKKFLLFYIVNGIGAAIVYCLGVGLYAYFTGSQKGLLVPVVGASGSLFALMLAYGWLFGDRVIYFFMMFPMKARYFVMILAFIQFASLMSSGVVGGEVAYLAHLGGLISGVIYMLVWSFLVKLELDKRAKKKSRNLRLVVDNEKEEPASKKDPRYWN